MLTNAVISGAKPHEKPFKLRDGGGLYLLVTPGGKRWWRLRFRVHGKERMLSLGVFPEVKLAEARDLRDEARRDLRKGVDLSAKRRIEKLAGGDTFEAIVREWFEKFSTTWAPGLAGVNWFFRRVASREIVTRLPHAECYPQIIIRITSRR